MITVKNISDYINSFAPYETKCEWDNCGILIGRPNSEVKKIGFCLDLTTETLAEAEKQNVDLIVTHHPAIFKAKKNFLDNDAVFEAAVKNISVISAHTCFDCAQGGVNDVLASLLGLNNLKGVESAQCSVPMARIGTLDKAQTSEEFAKFVAQTLKTTVRAVNCQGMVKTVAVCGGAGMSFLDDIIADGADAYVTGDISHHEMLEAKERGITVVAAGHFETEYPAMNALKEKISLQFENVECVLLKQSNPINFIS